MPPRPHTCRVLVVADSHLSEDAPEAVSNWGAVASAAAEADLVIHAGDLTLDGAARMADLEYARRVLDELPAPWSAIPGNHDIGDNPGGSEDHVVDQDRLDRWHTTIGPDHWAVEFGEWTAVGINAQLLGSGLRAEAEQWAWLEDCLADQAQGQRVILITHKPLTASSEELAASPSYRFVPASARQRITALLDKAQCPLVVSGHVHQHRILDGDGRRHVWAPTTWAVLPDRAQKTFGLKRCGALSLELATDGAARVEMIEPPGLSQLTVGQDVPDPYHV